MAAPEPTAAAEDDVTDGAAPPRGRRDAATAPARRPRLSPGRRRPGHGASLTVRSAKVSGRTLTLSLQRREGGDRAGVGQARLAVRGQGRGEARGRRRVKLTLNRKLGRGTYTVKVISGTATVGCVRLKLAALTRIRGGPPGPPENFDSSSMDGWPMG